MYAKLQKEFKVIIGTNDTNKDESHLFGAAAKLEQYGNSNLGVRFHISEREQK